MIVKEWLDKEENSNSEWNSIVQTRLKLARNMAGIPFPDNMTTAEAAEVNDKVSQAVQKWNESGGRKQPVEKVVSFRFLGYGYPHQWG